MTRALKSATRGSRGPNFAAFLVTACVITYVYLNSDPVISGTEPQTGAAAVIGPPQIQLPPAPPQAEPSDAAAASSGEVATTAGTAATPSDPSILTGRWAMLFSLTLLQRGCDVKNVGATWNTGDSLHPRAWYHGRIAGVYAAEIIRKTGLTMPASSAGSGNGISPPVPGAV